MAGELPFCAGFSGGVVECIVEHLPAGLGEPAFEKLDANLAKALMSIGAVKAVEIGEGTNASRLHFENNDCYRENEDGTVDKTTNHSGGILGGISDGSPLQIRASFKPDPVDRSAAEHAEAGMGTV